MIHDIENTSKHGDDFQRYRDENPEMCDTFKEVQVQIYLCNHKVWPALRMEKLLPKAEMACVMTAFSAYYASTPPAFGAKAELSWVFSYGNASVRPVYGGTRGFGHRMFSKFRMDLENPCQLALLLLFNEKDTWTTEEICIELGIDAGKCERYCDSLSKGRAGPAGSRRSRRSGARATW